jgi:hypothetical protein
MLRARSCRTVPVLVLILLAACDRHEDVQDADSELANEATDPDLDNATLRRHALSEWFDEAHTSLHGPFSREFREEMLRTAALERLRWGALLPGPNRDGIDLVTGTTWSSLGPTKANNLINGSITLHVSDSGRARTIIVDGTTIYLATAGGGVWKRTAGTWVPLTESVGTLSCGSLAMDPVNHNNLYLGLGDPFDGTGIGLLKSTDGGASWSSPVFLGTSTVIPQVMVDPSDPSIILAATNAGLFRSTDAGTSFSFVPIATGQAVAPYVWSIASTGAGKFVLSLEANAAATSGTTDGQVWTSADHGATWTRATGPTSVSGVGRITVASAPSSPTTVYAMAAIPNNYSSTDLADFYKSVNGGQTWTALAVTNKRYANANVESSKVGTILGGQGWYGQLVVVSPTDPNTVYWGGQLLLAKTTDGGGTYRQVSNWLAQYSLPYVHADFHAGTIDAAGNLFVGTDGGIFESTDGGTTFTDTLNQSVVTHLLYSVGSSPNATDVVIGGMQDDGTRLRVGTSSVFDEVIGGDGFGANVNRSNAQQMLGSLYYLRIQKSTNGGASWASATTGITEVNNSSTAPFITRLIPWEGSTTGNEIFTFSNFKVYKSTNYAGSWAATAAAPISSGVIRHMGVAASNINIIGVVASGGRVLLSSNGGASWTTVASGASPDPMALPNSNLSLSWIHFDVSNPNTVYVASVAADATKSHLWKSTNFGASWTAIDGNNGLPSGAPVNTIKSDPVPAAGQPGMVLYAGTHMGVYRSTDAGTSWSRFGGGMPLVSVTDLYISPDDSLVRAATYGRGFWQLNALAANDFSISASPATVSVVQGSSGTTTVSTMVTAGMAEAISLSATGLPAGATATFTPTSVTAGGSSTLTLAAGATTMPGTYTVTITGTAASATHTARVTLVVSDKSNFSISAAATTVSVVQGSSSTTTVMTTPTAGTPETVTLSASDLPPGATATFAPTSATAGANALLTVAADATTPEGTYTITVTGTAASATHTLSITLNVTALPGPGGDDGGGGGGCGCGANQKPDAANGAIFVMALGLLLRRRAHRSHLRGRPLRSGTPRSCR